MKPAHEAAKRSVAKTISWRVIATILTLSIIYFYTGKFIQSLNATLTVAVVSTLLYYLHERAWSHVAWGRK